VLGNEHIIMKVLIGHQHGINTSLVLRTHHLGVMITHLSLMTRFKVIMTQCCWRV